MRVHLRPARAELGGAALHAAAVVGGAVVDLQQRGRGGRVERVGEQVAQLGCAACAIVGTSGGS
eukprot:2360547-Prymnesium_polylepis.1